MYILLGVGYNLMTRFCIHPIAFEELLNISSGSPLNILMGHSLVYAMQYCLVWVAALAVRGWHCIPFLYQVTTSTMSCADVIWDSPFFSGEICPGCLS